MPPAVVVAIAGYLLADWLFIAPRGDIALLDADIADTIGAAIYFSVSTVIIGLTEAMRQSALRLADSRDQARASEADLKALFDAACIGHAN